ncbi:hypothetical protein BZA70DRAFT_228980, partial [Myxozyma melibiosi]
GTIADVKHIVMFMQENRAFDHYFGSMAGVRGFKDPNVKIGSNGLPIWYQPTDSDEAEYLLPYYLAANSSYKEGIQCTNAGSNDWIENHGAWNNGEINGWVTNNSERAWGYLRRDDVPTHFEVAEAWTVGDMYSEFLIGPTGPNRASWISGSLNIGGTVGDRETVGGPFIENWFNDECEENNGVLYDCYPLAWDTMPERLEDNDISWFVYRDEDSSNDDPMWYFENFKNANSTDPLAAKGLTYAGFPLFLEQAANGTLPEVSWIIGSFPLSEHTPNLPRSGAWIIEKTIEAVMNGPLYNETVILISYDETGGWGDHVPPFVSPNGTAGEWDVDYRDTTQYVPAGPGFRLPFFAISPWSRGGHVFTEPSDHTSQLMFIEAWAAANGKNVTLSTINGWRREHMSDLTGMFDFENPSYDLPTLTNVSWPRYSDGAYVATDDCQEANDGYTQPPIPYGEQNITESLWTESGYKPIRGALTEGRYLVFAQEVSGKNISLVSFKGSKHLRSEELPSMDSEKNRFVVYQQDDAFSHDFKIKSYAHDVYLNKYGYWVDSEDDAGIYTIDFYPSEGYTIK